MAGLTLLALAALLLVPEGASCFAAARPIAAGAVLTAADLAPAPCKAAGRPPLRYDRASGHPVALAALSAGTYLGRLAPIGDRLIPAGTPLVLRSRAGVVTIERNVTAMQPGRSGSRMFVRDSSGEIFAVPLVLDAR